MSEHDSPNAPGQTWHRWQMGDLESDAYASRRQDGASARHRAHEARVAQEQQALRDAFEQARREGFEAGRAEGYTAGHHEGHAAGLEESHAVAELEFQKRVDTTLAPLAPLAEEFRRALATLDGQVGDQLVELALITGRQLAGESLAANPEHVLSVVRELLEADTSLSGRPRLWLHPEDLILVEASLGGALAQAGWACQPDPTLERGGCRATSAAGGLDASLSTHWQAILDQRRARRRPHPDDTDSRDDG